MKILILFFLWRAGQLISALVAPRFIAYYGLFAHPEVLLSFNLPKFIRAFANFDGIYYLLIAKRGYQQYEQVFFPLYPLFIRGLSFLIKNKLIAGLLISNISFFLGLIFFTKYLKLISTNINQSQLILTVLFLLFFPTSFFFGAIYTEGLFFLLVILTFYLLKKEKIFLAGVAAFLASLTRLVGVFLFIPFLINLVSAKKKSQSIFYLLSSIFFPFFGLSLYMYFLYLTTNDPLAFFHSQTVFGPARSTKIIFLPQVYFRYLKIFFTGSLNLQYFIAVFEFFIFNLVFLTLLYEVYKIYRRFRLKKTIIEQLSLNLFSLVNILLPTLTGSFMSVPRFALLSLSFFIFLGKIKNRWLIHSLLIAFLVLHLIILTLFIQGYFVS